MSEPVPTKAVCRPLPGRRSEERGFTAIEIAMVATVIAILALIVLPLFRNRVEAAKIAAAEADLTSLEKALTLAQADTSFYPRLEDLDNTEGNPYNDGNPTPTGGPANGITLETPPFWFPKGPATGRDSLTLQEWLTLSGSKSSPRFKGPYIAFQRSMTYQELKDSDIQFMIMRSAGPGYAVGNDYAPIWDIPVGDAKAPGLYDSDDNRIPIDPWGNPYLFFPATGETPFNNNVIYSLGPNGTPGDGDQATVPDFWVRRVPSGVDPSEEDTLGEGDDIMRQF